MGLFPKVINDVDKVTIFNCLSFKYYNTKLIFFSLSSNLVFFYQIIVFTGCSSNLNINLIGRAT